MIQKKAEELRQRLETARLKRNLYDLSVARIEAGKHIDSFVKKGDEHFSLGNTDEAIQNYKTALSVARTTDEHEKVREILIILGNTYASLRDYRLSVEHYRLAESMISKMRDDDFELSGPQKENLAILPFSRSLPSFIVSKQQYGWVLIITLLLSITIGVFVFFTRNPLILLLMQFPIILLYLSTHFFMLGEKLRSLSQP